MNIQVLCPVYKTILPHYLCSLPSPVSGAYIMSDTQIIPWIIALFRVHSGAGGYSRDFILSEPWGLLSTFAGSSIILILVLLAIFIAARSDDSQLRTIALSGIFLMPFYYPGPLHASSTIMGAVSIYRFAKFIIPIIAILIAIGLLRV